MTGHRREANLSASMKITKNIIFAISLGLVASTGADEVKILKVGTKPESVCRGFDGKLFVSIINAEEPGDGGINIIDGDKVKEFCRGMNSPKGLAFVGGFLVTADETTVWKVTKNGKATKLAEKKDFPNEIEFLNDVVASRDKKSVYVTEMSSPGPMFDPDKERTLWPINSKQDKELPSKGCVYKVTLEGKVTLAVPAGNKLMRFPNGVTVTGKKGEEILVMGDFFTGNIVAYNKEKFRVLAKGMRGADGVAFGPGAIYVSSWPLGKVWKYDRKAKKLTVLSDKFTTAADFFFDRKNKQLIIPDMLGGTLTFLPVE